MSIIQIPRLIYNIVEHCNLRCAKCDHASPWFSQAFAELSSFIEDLRSLTEICKIDELTFAGGEPLLHQKLTDFISLSRKNNFSRELRLLTNGTLLQQFPEAGFNYLDYIIISIYPEVRYGSSLKAFANISEKYNVFVGVFIRREFRYALLNSPIQNEKIVRAIHKGCMLRVFCHTVYKGRYYRCPRAHNLKSRMQVAGMKAQNIEADGISLHGNQYLRDELLEYLNEDTPLSACNYCLGSFGISLQTHQLNKKQILEEQNISEFNQIAYIDPNIDLNNPPLPEQPKPGWVKDVFEELHSFLGRIEKSCMTIEEFVSASRKVST